MLKTRVTWGGRCSRRRLFDLAGKIAQDRPLVSISEWDDHQADGHPAYPGPEWYHLQMLECADAREPITLTARYEDDDRGLFDELIKDLEGYALTWRVFDPGRHRPEMASGPFDWHEGSIEMRGPGSVDAKCAATNNGDPYLIVHEDNRRSAPKLLCSAETAYLLRWAPVPPIDLLDK